MKTGSLIREHKGSYLNEAVGQGLAGVGDIDGDRVPDYAVMGPKKNPDDGRVVFYSGKTGKQLFYFRGDDITGAIYSTFGWALRPVGDLDRDGFPDLVVQVYSFPNYSYLLVVSSRPRPLTRDPSRLSLAKGGKQLFHLAAGPAQAGKFYWLLGSMSGVLPGLWLGPHFLPLNPDAYFLHLLAAPNSLIPGSLGLLDKNGRAEIAWTLPPGLPAALSGKVLDHAYLVLDPKTLRLDLASNPVPLLLVK